MESWRQKAKRRAESGKQRVEISLESERARAGRPRPRGFEVGKRRGEEGVGQGLTWGLDNR